MKNWIFLIIPLILFSCKEDEPRILPVDDTEVNLSNLRIGQKSLYVKYNTNCDNFEGAFNIVENDKISLEVISFEEGLGFRETVLEGSSYYTGTEDDITEYKIEQWVNGVYMPNRSESRLFFFFGADLLPTSYLNRVDLYQNGCLMHQGDSPFIGNDIGEIQEMKIGEFDFKGKTAMSCVPNFELDAYLIYDNTKLHCSHTVYIDSFFGDNFVEGWLLLEE